MQLFCPVRLQMENKTEKGMGPFLSFFFYINEGQGFSKTINGGERTKQHRIRSSRETVYLNVSSEKETRKGKRRRKLQGKSQQLDFFCWDFFFLVVVLVFFGLILHDHCKLAIIIKKKSFSVICEKVPLFNKTSECEHRLTLECLVSSFAFLLPAGAGRGGYSMALVA